MQTAIVAIIVAIALFFMVRRFVRFFSGANKTAPGCGCGCGGCGAASGECGGRESERVEKQ